MTWRVYLAETASGLRHRHLEVTDAQWEDEVNGIGGGSITVLKKSLKGLTRDKYSEIRGALVFCYVHSDGTEVPWVGGPITGRPEENLTTLKITWAGMRHMMLRRLAVRERQVQQAQEKLLRLIQTRKDADAAKERVRVTEKLVSTRKKDWTEKEKAARDAVGLTKTTGRTFYQAAMPGGVQKNDLWIRTPDGTPFAAGGSPLAYVQKSAPQALTALNAKISYDAAVADLATFKTQQADAEALAEQLEADTEQDFNVTLTGTLGGIAWKLVELAQQKPNGLLPVVHGTPYEDGSSRRVYNWWNLANNHVDKLLTEISEADNGPDIHFRPMWGDANQTRFVWVMVHGTLAQPTIAQEWTPDWDTTAEDNDIVTLDVNNDSSTITDRVYVTGSGSGAGTRIAQAEDLRFVKTGRPFTESVVSNPDRNDDSVLLQRARGYVRSNLVPYDQVSLTIRADSAKNVLGRWRVGDAAQVTFGPGWTHIPEGTHLMRIISAKGNLSEEITLEMQEDQW